MPVLKMNVAHGISIDFRMVDLLIGTDWKRLPVTNQK